MSSLDLVLNIHRLVVDSAGAISLGVGLLSLFVWLFQPCPKSPPYVPQVGKVDLQECRIRWQKTIAKDCPKTGHQYLVIGAGFLGSRIIEALLARGEKNIRVFDFDKNLPWAKDPRVEFVAGDLRYVIETQRACVGIHTIFMTAASIRFMDNMNFQWERSYQVNVVGMENVLFACEMEGVQNLIFTSTMNANVPRGFDGFATLLKEEMPFVTRENSTSHYATTKAMAEQLVKDANGRNGLKTISMRPGGLFGAHDKLIMETVLSSDMYVFLGVKVEVDFVAIDNVVYAHLLGEAALRKGKGTGDSFNVTNEEPMSNDLFRHMMIHYAKTRTVIQGPPRFFHLLAYLNQACAYVLRSRMPSLGDLEYLTPSAMALMELTIRMDPSKSQSVLGYHPIFTVDEGVQLGVLEYKHNLRL